MGEHIKTIRNMKIYKIIRPIVLFLLGALLFYRGLVFDYVFPVWAHIIIIPIGLAICVAVPVFHFKREDPLKWGYFGMWFLIACFVFIFSINKLTSLASKIDSEIDSRSIISVQNRFGRKLNALAGDYEDEDGYVKEITVQKNHTLNKLDPDEYNHDVRYEYNAECVLTVNLVSSFDELSDKECIEALCGIEDGLRKQIGKIETKMHYTREDRFAYRTYRWKNFYVLGDQDIEYHCEKYDYRFELDRLWSDDKWEDADVVFLYVNNRRGKEEKYCIYLNDDRTVSEISKWEEPTEDLANTGIEEPKIYKMRVGLSEQHINETEYGQYTRRDGGFVGSWNHQKNYAYDYYWEDSKGKQIIKVHVYNGVVDYYWKDGIEYKE